MSKKIIPIPGKHKPRKREDASEDYDTIKPATIKWLWPGRIPLGKLTLLFGDPGIGKSLLTTTIAAHVSTGKPWPDGSKCPEGETLLFSAHDNVPAVIVPRLIAAGADLTKVFNGAEVQSGDGTMHSFSMLENVNDIADTLEAHPDIKLIVIDPIFAYMGNVDEYSNASVSAMLAPWRELATRYEVTVLMITFINDETDQFARYRAYGSDAFTGSCPHSFVLASDYRDPDNRLLLPARNSLAPDIGGLEFTIAEQDGYPVIQWGPNPATISADEALEPPDEDQAAISECCVWMLDFLSSGPQRGKVGIREGSQLGFNKQEMCRARERLGVAAANKSGPADDGKQSWTWELPKSKTAAKKGDK